MTLTPVKCPNQGFDPEQSELARNPEKLHHYIHLLEAALGHGAKIVGMLEIGSFAKGEAVDTSDVDTRVYVTLPAAYLFNVDQTLPEAQPAYAAFLAHAGLLPPQIYTWADFNIPIIKQISQQVGCPIHFGLADQRYAAFELAHLDSFASLEYSFLFQSNLLYDPQNFLAQTRQALSGKIYPTLVDLYTAQALERLAPRIYDFLQPHPLDRENMEWSGQIEWVNMAVRCLRNAVAAKSYGSTGVMLYKKPEILQFYRQHLPDDVALVQQLYAWKTDPATRAAMVKAFAVDSAPFFATFRSLMAPLASLVAKVRDLTL